MDILINTLVVTAASIHHLVDRLYQFGCGLAGHKTMIHYERDGDLRLSKMYIVCNKCGWKSEGWDL